MTTMLEQMKADIREDRQVARVKEQVRRELAKLPDDESRRRVIVATGALLGYPVCTNDEHPR